MPVTLEQAKVGLADKVDQQVIDEFRRDSFILDKLTFDNCVSPGTGGSTLTYGYVRLKTPSVAEGRALNSEYKPGEAVKEQHAVDLKIFGGAFEVDRVLEDSAAQSEIAFQLEEKVKAAANKFHYDFINGSSTAKGDNTSFDGLAKMLKGASTEHTPETPIDLSTPDAIAANMDDFTQEIDIWLGEFAEKPDMLLMNSRMYSIMKRIARKQGFYSHNEDAFGVGVEKYDGIELRDMGQYYDSTKNKTVNVIPVNESDHTTAIYAVKFGLKALHGVALNGTNRIIKTYLPDLKAPGAVKKGEVEMVAAIALKNSKQAGVFKNIKVEAGA